jgi:molybdopterin-guanine dinucleotide biosynthesis protein A
VTTVAGLLLTGGRSRRLGIDKAGLVLDGTTLGDRGAALLRATCDPVLEIGPGHTTLPVVREDPPGSGPLAALAAGGEELARRGHRGSALLMAVDLPVMTVAFLEFLRDWAGEPTVIPAVEGRVQPVCARYGADALVASASLVTGGVASLRALLDVVDNDVVDEDQWRAVATADVLADVDTPDDARRLGVDLGDASVTG